MSTLIKVIVNIKQDLAEAVDNMAKDSETNKTTIINQAIANYKYISNLQKSGGRILIENEAGKLTPVLFE